MNQEQQLQEFIYCLIHGKSPTLWDYSGRRPRQRCAFCIGEGRRHGD